MAYNFPQGQTTQTYNQPLPNQTMQPILPQPNGNVYNINSSFEVANVPVGAGVSVALCMPENVMFIKTMQNGNPLFYPYKILPFNNEAEQTQSAATTEINYSSQIEECMNRIANLEKILKKKGDDFDI